MRCKESFKTPDKLKKERLLILKKGVRSIWGNGCKLYAVDDYPENVLYEDLMIGSQALICSRWQYNLAGDRLYRLTRLPQIGPARSRNSVVLDLMPMWWNFTIFD
jgi:hypothetical protein